MPEINLPTSDKQNQILDRVNLLSLNNSILLVSSSESSISTTTPPERLRLTGAGLVKGIKIDLLQNNTFRIEIIVDGVTIKEYTPAVMTAAFQNYELVTDIYFEESFVLNMKVDNTSANVRSEVVYYLF
ncbi:hypothetical protein [Sporosarcina sp. P17b]|uniref:hypothetical protein n=1 Tax=Sporosarcina sp. P17b TaxID=2048260 RepID=UPI000C169397|nr:hypothetical protein [Sporosarcina sp. P17b]PIC70805.1 hypothetical protein CSV76_16940 [Sporosarcina sp. P17b]